MSNRLTRQALKFEFSAPLANAYNVGALQKAQTSAKKHLKRLLITFLLSTLACS